MTNLPDKAAKKFMELRHLADNLQALISSSLARASELRRALQNNPISPEAPNWEFEIDRLQSHVATLQAKAGNASQLLATLSHWLPTLRPDQKLVETPAIKLPLLHGDTHVAAVARIRQEISSLGAELYAVNHAGPTLDEQREAARKYVDGLLAKTKPTVKVSHSKFELNFSSDSSFTPKANVAAAMAWLDPDRFLKNIISVIDATPQPRIVMTAKEKSKRKAEIEAELLKNERIEEWLISDAAIDDVHIPRRPLANPYAVLGVEAVTASKEAAAA
jgi:hypothetical protein